MMLKPLVLTLFFTMTNAASAEMVVSNRVIRAKEIISLSDLTTENTYFAGAFSSAQDVVGLEARRTLYPGRPILSDDIGFPAVIERNDLILLVFELGGLQIKTEGRALNRGAVGDRVRVMNLASKAVLNGTITSDGAVEIE